MTTYYHAPIDVLGHFQYKELPRLLNVTGVVPSIPKPEAKYPGQPVEDQLVVDLTRVSVFNLTLCIGKEWYRFPSHFFVPQGVNVEFIKSEFDGHLPRQFSPPDTPGLLGAFEKTRIIHPDLNDLNQEEPLHYVSQYCFPFMNSLERYGTGRCIEL